MGFVSSGLHATLIVVLLLYLTSMRFRHKTVPLDDSPVYNVTFLNAEETTMGILKMKGHEGSAITEYFIKKGIFYEPEIARELIRASKFYGGNILEVGGNIGAITVPTAFFSNSKMLVIEGDFNNSMKLAQNIELNRLHNVKLVRGILGEREDEDVCLVQIAWDMGSNLVDRDHKLCEKLERSITIDKVMRENIELMKDVRVVKMDIENSEPDALRGAQEWLKKYPPCEIIVECEFGSKKEEEITEIIGKFGFEASRWEKHSEENVTITPQTIWTLQDSPKCEF